MEHLIVQLGVLLAACAIVALIFDALKQSAILAFIAVGLAASLGGMHFDEHVMHAFSETGIILLLFMAGLEVDLKGFLARWKMVLEIGLGQILITASAGSLLAWLVVGIEDVTTIVYFGLCLTFSSTIIVLGLLKERREMGSLHGQLLLGLLVLQDITAVIGLAILSSLSSGESFLPAIGMLFVKMGIIAALLAATSKFVLAPLFRKLAHSPEHLFLGTLGWAMGIAAACEYVHFSPEIGAFMAGVAVGVLPYRLEIEDKVDPLKSFGIILFFVSLGYSLEFNEETMSYAVPVLAVVLFTVIGTLPIMLFLSYLARIKSRPAFMMGGIINQISEFSLILATLCLQAGVFETSHFMIITLACVVTIVISGIGHQMLQSGYGWSEKMLGFLDSHASRDEGGHGELEGHVVLLAWNELAETIWEHMKGEGKTVVVVDIDPDVHEALTAKNEPLLKPMYADMYDPDTWEESGMETAELVISCAEDCQPAELAILHWMHEHGVKVQYMATTESSAEALELYEAGASFVIQSSALAAQKFGEMLNSHDLAGFNADGVVHKAELAAARERSPAEFRFT